MRVPASLPLALLLGLALAGCSAGDGGQQPLPPEWRGRDLRKAGWANETLQPGWTLAVEHTWSAGTRIAWDWVVVAPVQSQDPVFTAYVHFQLVNMDASGGPRPLVAHDAQEGVGERTIVESGVHQLDWMNEWTQPVTVAYKAPAGGKVITYPPGEGPGCLYGARSAQAACLALPSGPR